MVSGPDAEITRVEGIIRQLDPAGKPGAKEETRVIRLKNASATELLGLVEKSLNSRQQSVRVLLDARSNSLVVTGDTASVETASQIIQQLDTPSNVSPRELRVIELKSSEASLITPMLNSLFSEIVKDRRGADYVTPTKIVPDSGIFRSGSRSSGRSGRRPPSYQCTLTGGILPRAGNDRWITDDGGKLSL